MFLLKKIIAIEQNKNCSLQDAAAYFFAPIFVPGIVQDSAINTFIFDFSNSYKQLIKALGKKALHQKQYYQELLAQNTALAVLLKKIKGWLKDQKGRGAEAFYEKLKYYRAQQAVQALNKKKAFLQTVIAQTSSAIACQYGEDGRIG